MTKDLLIKPRRERMRPLREKTAFPFLTLRSRGNLPNPIFNTPYVPVNTPAIGDLFDMFDFGQE
jgi:hypothetical protein